jgi:hypothetical protein
MSYVYFIQAGEDGPIKIGYSARPENRLRELQLGNWQDLFLLKKIRGSSELEATYHSKFADAHIRSEWFHPIAPLTELIEGLESEPITLSPILRYSRDGDLKRPKKITDIEQRIKASGASVDDLCAAAKIHRATWQRWKAGIVGPTFTNWRAVEDAVEAITTSFHQACPNPTTPRGATE